MPDLSGPLRGQFRQRLFRAQTRTLSREIHKRQRKLEKLKHSLLRRRPADRGKKPTAPGVKKKIQEILRGSRTGWKAIFPSQAGKRGLRDINSRGQWRLILSDHFKSGQR